MVNAGLAHNPYLLETTAKFNGSAPKLNSQIEKYAQQPLSDWINKVPDIFSDEMNGYDFDLYFSGTKADFEALRATFAAAGVIDDVRLKHTETLEPVEVKLREINNLLEWLKNNANHLFDYSDFVKEHNELFDYVFLYIIIRGDFIENTRANWKIEKVSCAGDLKKPPLDNKPLDNKPLDNKPILLYIDAKSIDAKSQSAVHGDVNTLLSRPDISQKQIFFMIDPALDHKQIIRVLQDLGVESPQIVAKYDDPVISDYMRNYPILDYIRTSLGIFSNSAETTKKRLEEERQKSLAINASTKAEMAKAEKNINDLQKIEQTLAKADITNYIEFFQDIRAELLTKICNWRWRFYSDKVIGEAKAKEAAFDYETDLHNYVNNFLRELCQKYQLVALDIKNRLRKQYLEQSFDTVFMPDVSFAEPYVTFTVPPMVETLYDLRDETDEFPKTDLVDRLKSQLVDNRQKVHVITCYYDKWHKKAEEIIMSQAEVCIKHNNERLRQYYTYLVVSYRNHLQELIAAQQNRKAAAHEKLSADERLLRTDNDWLQTFCDQIINIERG